MDVQFGYKFNELAKIKKMDYRCYTTNSFSVELLESEQIFTTFKDAYNRNGSTIVVEWGDYYSEK